MNGIGVFLGILATLSLAGQPAAAADLHPKTAAAFDRYVQAIEAQMARRPAFLWVDTPGDRARRATRDALDRGELVIESIDRDDTGVSRDVPDGMVHHWIGTVFVPGTTVDQTLALLQDYDRHAQIYAPAVSRSRLLSHSHVRQGSGGQAESFRMALRFTMTRVITVVVNTESDAVFTRDARDRAHSVIHSTRVAQVEEAGTPGEHELPVGHDGGYLWRINSYWRLQERTDAAGRPGTDVECESISLTRDIPFGFGWVVKPFVTSLPKDSLAFTLETTRTVLKK